jgi:hypothetical protein
VPLVPNFLVAFHIPSTRETRHTRRKGPGEPWFEDRGEFSCANKTLVVVAHKDE